MSKESGLGSLLLVNGLDVSGDISGLDTISTPVELLGVTGINKSAQERIGGHVDGQLAFTSFFNPGPEANAAHTAFSGLPTTDVHALYIHKGVTGAIGGDAFGIVAKQASYDPSRGDDGALTFGVSMPGAAYGGEWGDLLTAGVSTLGGTGSLGSLDYGATVGTTNFGLQAYLQVTAFTGTSATVAIQGSSDNGGADAWANVTGAVFAAASVVGGQRIQTARNQAVERYLRVNVTGTFSNLAFAVMVVRNTVERII